MKFTDIYGVTHYVKRDTYQLQWSTLCDLFWGIGGSRIKAKDRDVDCMVCLAKETT